MSGWITILQVGGLAGVVSAVCTFILNLLRDRHQINREASYAALRASIALEGFATRCLDIIVQAEISRDMGGVRTKAGVLPALPDLPPDTNWRSLPHDLGGRFLGFSNLIASGQSRVDGAAFETDDYHHHETEAAVLGDKAWRLAVELRSKHSLPVNIDLEQVGRDLRKHAGIREEEIVKWRSNA